MGSGVGAGAAAGAVTFVNVAAEDAFGRVDCLFTIGLVVANLLTAWFTIRSFGLPDATLPLACPARVPGGAVVEPGFHALEPGCAAAPLAPAAAGDTVAAVVDGGAGADADAGPFLGAPSVGNSKSSGLTGSGGGGGAGAGCDTSTPGPPLAPRPNPPSLGPLRERTLLPSPLLPMLLLMPPARPEPKPPTPLPPAPPPPSRMLLDPSDAPCPDLPELGAPPSRMLLLPAALLPPAPPPPPLLLLFRPLFREPKPELDPVEPPNNQLGAKPDAEEAILSQGCRLYQQAAVTQSSIYHSQFTRG